MFELIYNVVFNYTISDANYAAVFRTSLSSIFGYIFGMSLDVKPEEKAEYKSNEHFEATTKKEPIEESQIKQKFILTSKGANVIVLYATIICILSIITIVIAEATHAFNYTEGLVQVRSMISLTIGYLVSQANRN